jgi:hypothetical protein
LGISIRQLAPTFAGEVTGVDGRRPLSPDQVAAIHAGMAEYAVLVFRDQPLTDEEQLRFTLQVGALENLAGALETFVTLAAIQLAIRRLARRRLLSKTALYSAGFSSPGLSVSRARSWSRAQNGCLP